MDVEVDVVAIASACTEDGCAELDIRLRIPEPVMPPGDAFVYGDARLLHKEWTEQACLHVRDDDCFFGGRL